MAKVVFLFRPKFYSPFQQKRFAVGFPISAEVLFSISAEEVCCGLWGNPPISPEIFRQNFYSPFQQMWASGKSSYFARNICGGSNHFRLQL